MKSVDPNHVMNASSLPLPAGSSRPVASDCRYYLGDRPCVWHKREGALCVCERYEAVSERILMIKLDAMGDVLRTTALLPALAKAHPHGAFTWITRSESVPLLQHNPYLESVVAYGPDAFVQLGAVGYDRVINLDAGKISAGLAALARSPRKDGFVLHEKGYVIATNAAAQQWLELGLFDDLKRQNRRTYQDLMAAILVLPPGEHSYVLHLLPSEHKQARQHLQDLGLDFSRPIVGLNTGGSDRWELKRWRLDGFRELIERLHLDFGAQPLLLGGKAERERNRELRESALVPVFDSGADNDVRHFAALVACCDVVVTGDTLAMHLTLASSRRVVALFGPTSAPEVELYGLGEKITPHMDCLACYKSSCDFVPNCMDLISVSMVAEAVARQLPRRSPQTVSLPLA